MCIRKSEELQGGDFTTKHSRQKQGKYIMEQTKNDNPELHAAGKPFYTVKIKSMPHKQPVAEVQPSGINDGHQIPNNQPCLEQRRTLLKHYQESHQGIYDW